jgi:hypothetical protein
VCVCWLGRIVRARPCRCLPLARGCFVELNGAACAIPPPLSAVVYVNSLEQNGERGHTACGGHASYFEVYKGRAHVVSSHCKASPQRYWYWGVRFLGPGHARAGKKPCGMV